METQNIANLLNESSRFAARKWYINNDLNNGQYGRGNENGLTIKFETKFYKSNLFDAYIPAYVPGDIKVADVAPDTNVAFKSCSSFTRCATRINDEHVETAENLNIIANLYNLIEYSDKYADSSGSPFQFNWLVTILSILQG